MKQYIKDGVVRNAGQIQIFVTDGDGDRRQILNPGEKDILADGWVEYAPETPAHRARLRPGKSETSLSVLYALARKYGADITREVRALPDQEALEFKALFDTWADYDGKQVEAGTRLYYDNRLFKVRQTHTVAKHMPPSVDTASLYEEICEQHAGTSNDPVPYHNNMRLEPGKFYTQGGKMYECFRDSGVAVYNNLEELIDIYVKAV